eukprot:6717223-Alexandrium_andersonii.AAC.1
MSASLVGSEMCIRDRLGPSWLGPGMHELLAYSILVALCFHSFMSDEMTSCLLYTSDAADDM